MSENAEKIVTTNESENEITIFSLDLVAFLAAKFKIKEERDGKSPSPNIPGRNVAFWVFKRTPELESAMSEWNARKDVSTRDIFEFREEQFRLRNRKAKLERMP